MTPTEFKENLVQQQQAVTAQMYRLEGAVQAIEEYEKLKKPATTTRKKADA